MQIQWIDTTLPSKVWSIKTEPVSDQGWLTSSMSERDISPALRDRFLAYPRNEASALQRSFVGEKYIRSLHLWYFELSCNVWRWATGADGRVKSVPGRIWTCDLSVISRPLYRWATGTYDCLHGLYRLGQLSDGSKILYRAFPRQPLGRFRLAYRDLEAENLLTIKCGMCR